MTEERARQVANVVMAAAALGAAVLVLKSPRLRRLAWQLARHYASRAARRLDGDDRSRRLGRLRSRAERRATASRTSQPSRQRRKFAGYNDAVIARRAVLRLYAEIRLTLLAIWRGVVGFYNSDDLTFASSIAYYTLLSLFPFFLLAFSILGSVSSDPADRAVDPRIRAAVFSAPVRVRHHPARCDAAEHGAAGRRRHAVDDLGRDGGVRRDYLRGQSRLGRREAADLPQAQADFVRDAGGGQPAAARRPAPHQRHQRRRGALVRGGGGARARSSRSCTTSRSAGRAPRCSSPWSD